MSDWKPTISPTSSVGRWTAPEGEEVLTKIDDERGERNEARLTRRGNLWYTGGPNSMYVYYTPTHWRPL
jgi:hypothetical protein